MQHLLVPLPFLLLFSFALVVWFDNSANRGMTFTPALEPIVGGSGPVVGVNFFNIHMEPDPEAVRRSFELAAAMGARFARMQVPWDDLEIHARGDFEDRRNLEAVGAVSAWAKYDRLASLAEEFGIELIWRLERPPLWAREYFASRPEFIAGLERDGHSTGPPDDFADYANFVRAVVERYNGDGVNDAPGSPVVRYFQLWNEPNLKNEWNWQTPRPEDFVELLRVGATAAREANPNVVIIFPGLAPTDGLDPSAPMTELAYLDRVYRAGGAAYFDVMAAQAYGLGQSPDKNRYVFLRGRHNWHWRRPIDTRNDVSRVVLLREVMEAHGDHTTPVWVTEFGWNSAPPELPPERRLTWGEPVDEATKAAYLVGQLERARDQWPWMGVMNVWMLRYGGYAEPHPDDPTPYFALVSRDWELMPAYEALQAFSAAPAVLGVGSHLWQHPAVEPLPEGGWRIRFSGTRLVLLGGLDPEEGQFQGVLNGQPGGLEALLYQGQRAVATPHLPLGIHTLDLVGTPAPSLLLVERVRPWGWLWDYGPLGLLLALAVSGAASFSHMMHMLARGLRWLAGLQARLRQQRHPLARLIQPESLIMLGLCGAVLVTYVGSSLLPITLAGLGLFGLLALVRPDLALLWVPLTLPFYFIPKEIFDSRFALRDSGISLPLHEMLLLVVLIAALLRLGGGMGLLARRSSGPRRLASTGSASVAGAEPVEASVAGAEPVEASVTPPANPRPPVPGIIWSSWLLPTTLFVLAALWGVLIAEARGPALRELRWMVIQPLLFVGLAAGLAGWHTQQRGGNYWRVLLQAWLVGGVISALIALLQLAGFNLVPIFGTKAGFGADRFLVEGVQRVSGLYGHPNNLGLAMGRYWPLAAVVAYAAWWRGAKPIAWLYLLATLVCLGALLASFSRGAYLGAVVALGIVALGLLPRQLWRKRRLWWAGGGLAGLLVLGIGLSIALGIERLNPFGATGAIRLQTWASALAMLRDHPLGLGLDQFGQHYPNYIAAELRDTNEINTAHPHNLLLDIALRMGPLGLIACAWLIGNSYQHAWRQRRDPIVVGIIAAISASLAHGLVDQFYFWPDLAYTFWLLLAVMVLGCGSVKSDL
ncbi:O-antigen ligase family protein [Candidatus Viridilinea mediisalina]|nr:O-antigen ligase family protein [Candidatus Viridilinea mediisalina]